MRLDKLSKTTVGALLRVVAKEMDEKAKAGMDRGKLGDIAESLGTLLGNAEKQWRAWQGPRDAVVKALAEGKVAAA